MDTRFSNEPLDTVACDMLALAVGDDLDQALSTLDQRFEGKLLAHVRARRFTGAAGSSLSVPTFGRIGADELLLLGIGGGGAAARREAAARAGRQARTARVRHLALHLGTTGDDAVGWVEAAGIGNYAYDRYKKEAERTPALERLTVLGASGSDADAKRARDRLGGVTLTRDLVNAPAAEIYPETLAAAARELARIPHVEVEVWDEARLEKEGCVGILAVGQGSERRPCLIHVRYRPPGAAGHVALVGKGVTFDSGGLSLKPSGAMQTMRCDMGGAATVLGATRAVAEQGLPIAIDTFVGAVENMVSGGSFKLGDVLTYRNGVTVEIHNTDAEGRLVLADCLLQACEVPGVTHVLDLATLTGAVVVAIGSDFTGLFTDDDELAGSLQEAASTNGEGLWRLPLHAPYKELLKADWGQIKNVGSRDAGATTAALFLQHFVSDHVRWAHLDIAGSAFLEKGSPRYAAGATGEMVRTLSTWIEGQARG